MRFGREDRIGGHHMIGTVSSSTPNAGTRFEGHKCFFYLLILAIILAAPVSAFAVPPGTVISNMAEATYGVGTISGIISPSNAVTVTTIGNAPDAVDDSVTTEIDTPVAIYVLRNDTDPDGDALTITLLDLTTTQGGTTAINDNGTPGDPADDYVDYMPPPGFTGIDTFTYTIDDGNGGTDTATVTIAISTRLWMTKTANRDTVSIGDFVSYGLSVENVSALPMPGVVVLDALPLGFRYQEGSTTINGARAPDPAISPDGRTLTFALGNIAPGEVVTISYVVEVSAGARPGDAVNRAFAVSMGEEVSNIVSVLVSVKEDLFRGKSFIVGRVIADNCGDMSIYLDCDCMPPNDGVEGVRIYLEDGTYAITDEQGKFHFEGVRPGVHVVQLDVDTVPEAYEIASCEKNTRFAGRAFSRFVDLQGGTLWRTDFHLKFNPDAKGSLELQLEGSLKDDIVTYQVQLIATNVSLRNVRPVILLPEGITYVRGSSTMDDTAFGDPTGIKNVLTYRLGDIEGEWRSKLAFKGKVREKTQAGTLLTKAMVVFDTPIEKNDRTPLVKHEISTGSDLNEGQTGQRQSQNGKNHASIEMPGVLVNPEQSAPAVKREPVETMPAYEKAWLENAEPGLEWLWPGPGYGPPIPSLKLAIKHAPGDKLTLLLEGTEVSPLNFEAVSKNTAGTVAVSRWRGVDLREGDNRFEVVVRDANGKEKTRLQHVVHYSGPPVRAELIAEQSSLVADGKTPPRIAVRLTDNDGYPARHGIIGEFSVDPPYVSHEKAEALNTSPLSGLDATKPHYTTGKNGIAHVTLEPTSKTGEAVVRFHFADTEQELRVWLQPEYRDWILVGFAEGTVGYNTVSGNMESLDAADVDDEFYEDGRIAFFAKGRIKGKWLLTVAYDSGRDDSEVGDSLFQTIDPDTYYTLYGDGTQQYYDAPSAEKIFIKIERDRFYALFGDFDTGLTVTELSRYNRSLTGFKSELQTERYSVNVFASETSQAFVKDEIRGDGTSGLYNLSRDDIVMNSDKVTIEVRDRFRSEVILSSESLMRHIDYNIDYDAGTIFFKEPIFSKDENLNPIFIVVEYETNDTSGEEFTYGGRGAVRLLRQKLEVGGSYIHEGEEGAEGDLLGFDATLKINGHTELRAEFATSDKEAPGGDEEGDAYLVELAHFSGKIDATLYVREQEEGFGLGQQNSSEDGTRKIGGTVAYKFNEQVTANAQVYRQYNLADDAERDMAEVGIIYDAGTYSLRMGMRHAEDRLDDGTDNRSDQITAGVSKQLFDGRLVLKADHEQSLGGGNNENPDYPTRTILGADYKLTEAVTLFGTQEFTWGENEDTSGTRVGMRATPWTGGTVGTSVERQYAEDGARVFANLGLTQSWKVNEKWTVDAGLDHSHTVEDPGNIPFDPDVPPASGADSDFTALSVGTSYQEKTWSWNWRGEFRTSDTEDKWDITTGIYGEPSERIGLSAGMQVFDTDSDGGIDETMGDIRLGMAYRPRNSRWIVLDRLDFIFEDEEGGISEVESRRIVNNLNANYKLNDKTQIALQYGAKYISERIDGDSYSGYTDLMGVEARRDITAKWDVGVRASALHSWDSQQIDYSAGISIGHNLFENAWISLGYNFTGFEDEDFSQGDFTAEGPFIQLRFKFDQESMRDALSHLGGIIG
jgi:uncharacterized repeat protein (TIGR01451 family)